MIRPSRGVTVTHFQNINNHIEHCKGGVAPNVMDILKLKFPNKFRSSSSRNNSKKSGTTYNNNYNNIEYL